jgi:hypothetical protein
MYIGPIIVAMVTNLENKYNTNENLQNQHQWTLHNQDSISEVKSF